MSDRSRISVLEGEVERHGYLVGIALVLSILCCGFAAGVFMGQTKPNYDHIAITLTVFQTLFGIAALFGFWSLRSLTREKAEEVTQQEIEKIAPPIIRRAVQEELEKMRRKGQISATDAEDLVDALEDGKDAADGT